MHFQAFCLTAEKDTESNWHRLKYLPLPKVVEEFQTEIIRSNDKGMRKSFAGNMNLTRKRNLSQEGGESYLYLF